MTNGSVHAFPHMHIQFGKGVQLEGGLTKRELIAAMVLNGLCTLPGANHPKGAAEWSIKYADALLAELSKSEEPRSGAV